MMARKLERGSRRWKMRGFKRGLRQQNNGKKDAESVKTRQGKGDKLKGCGLRN